MARHAFCGVEASWVPTKYFQLDPRSKMEAAWLDATNSNENKNRETTNDDDFLIKTFFPVWVQAQKVFNDGAGSK
jgi:hypothetical protein